MNQFIEQGWDPAKGDEAELVRFAGLPPMKTQVTEMEALVPPAEMAVKVDEFLAAFKRAVRQGEAKPDTVLLISSTPFVKPQRLGAELGLAQGCGGA